MTGMDFTVRRMKASEYPMLRDFIYEAIYIPEGMERPPKEIADTPEQKVYYEGFGGADSDIACAAVAGGKVVGAAWARFMHDYGHVDDETPSLALAIFKDYRGQGIGTALMKMLLAEVRNAGHERISLSVQKSNPALHLYQRLGFRTVSLVMGETEEEYVMVKELKETAG